jgi:hypothetical protein
MDCVDDAEATVKAAAIAHEVVASGGDVSHPDLHISVVPDGREVSRVPLPARHWLAGPAPWRLEPKSQLSGY